MKKTQLSLDTARRIILKCQLLHFDSELFPGKEGVIQAIEKLGYVQIDTIAVIERAHHHTLWTRRPDFEPAMLDELMATDRRIFEYWGHGMSYLPVSDYRFYLPRMRSFYNPRGKWEKDRIEKFGYMLQPVLERVRQEGALSSSDFAIPDDRKRGTWWDWRPAKAALEILFWRGELMITRRRNFQRFYDLTERVLPPAVDLRFPDEQELGHFFVRRALSALGVAQEKAILNHIHAAGKDCIANALCALMESGEVLRVQIGSDREIDYYALPAAVETADQLHASDSTVHLLCPFDNLIIHRQRLSRLFEFEYALECYLPPAKRKFGYFTLPILWKENLIGRLDPKAHRQTKTLIIRNLAFEPQFNEFDEFIPAFVNKLKLFARFNRCDEVEFEKIEPKHLKHKLEKNLR
ncbi:YcaQ family DNA glycosylase [candidate division KSB1 bacterium]|nr:YcaQ family DNA glycosylase [candidate division KSB1 bacterium]